MSEKKTSEPRSAPVATDWEGLAKEVRAVTTASRDNYVGPYLEVETMRILDRAASALSRAAELEKALREARIVFDEEGYMGCRAEALIARLYELLEAR